MRTVDFWLGRPRLVFFLAARTGISRTSLGEINFSLDGVEREEVEAMGVSHIRAGTAGAIGVLRTGFAAGVGTELVGGKDRIAGL